MKKIRQYWHILLILVLALALRLPLLTGSFWLDEAAQALESARPLSEQFQIIPDFQPPLMHLLVHFSMYFSDHEAWLRFVAAVIPGLVSIWGTYEIGRRLISKEAGLLGALFLATNSFHIFYSQELRPYSLPAMWGVLSWLVLIASHLSLAKSFKNFSFVTSLRIKWFLFTLITILGLYSSYLYPFLLIAQIVWVFLWHREQLKKLIISLGLTVLAYLPWLPTFLRQLDAGGAVREQLPGWDEVVSIPQLKAIPLVFGKFIFGVVDLELNLGYGLLVLALSLLLLGNALMVLKKWRNLELRPGLYLLGLGSLIPLISSWIVSFWIPVVQPKRVLYLLPAFYLLLLIFVSQTKKPWLKYGLVGLVLAINLYGTWQYYAQPKYQRENWRSAIAQIEETYPATDTIAVFTFPEPYAPWRLYADPAYKTLSTETLNIKDVADLRETLKPAAEYKYVIVFDYLRDLTDPDNRLLTEIEAYGYKTVEFIDYPNIGFIRIYAKPFESLSYSL